LLPSYPCWFSVSYSVIQHLFVCLHLCLSSSFSLSLFVSSLCDLPYVCLSVTLSPFVGFLFYAFQSVCLPLSLCLSPSFYLSLFSPFICLLFYLSHSLSSSVSFSVSLFSTIKVLCGWKRNEEKFCLVRLNKESLLSGKDEREVQLTSLPYLVYISCF
jgi:hypothetical protein